MAKSDLELEEERKREKIKANQGKGNEPRGMLSELGHKIKKNPWKTLGTVYLLPHSLLELLLQELLPLAL